MYNDDVLLTPEEYEKIAKAYLQADIRLDESQAERLEHDILELAYLIKGSLISLAGFLGTSALHSLNESHILKLEKLFSKNLEFQPKHFSRDKTKTFLNMLGLESLLLNKLVSLAEQSMDYKEIFDIIKERTLLTSSLYKINGVISSYFL